MATTTLPIVYLRATDVMNQNNGDLTKLYYGSMSRFGVLGELAVAIFRAQKRSKAAKAYKQKKYTRLAYDVKSWSIGEICRIAARTTLVWGWKYDPKAINFEWVLYVDLPTGQVSFHSPSRLAGPDYPNEWDGARGVSEQRVCDFCDQVANGEVL